MSKKKAKVTKLLTNGINFKFMFHMNDQSKPYEFSTKKSAARARALLIKQLKRANVVVYC